MTPPIAMPRFLQGIAAQVEACRQTRLGEEGGDAIVDGWRRWSRQAAGRVDGVQIDEEKATACLGELSPGCQTCKEGTWDCIFLTMRCNCQCAFCCSAPGKAFDEPGSSFGPDVATIAENYARTRIRGISFSGGEPFLVPERLTAWARAMRARFPEAYLWVYTNGLLADIATLKTLSGLGLDEVRFNAAASGYNQPRVLAAMHAAAGLFPRVTVEIPAVPEDGDQLLGALPAWAAAGARHLNLHELMFEPGSPSAVLPGPRETVRLPDGRQAHVHPGSGALVLRIMETVAREGLPLAVNYCSLLNKVGQVNRRRQSLLPLTREDYEQVIPGAGLESARLASYVFFAGPDRYVRCHPDRFHETLQRLPGYAWARITRLAPLALNDRGGWVEFAPGPALSP